MYNITVNTGTAQYTVNNLGPQGAWAAVEINGQGPINFNSVGTNPLGPNNQEYGICIAFRDNVWAFRYNNQGGLAITYNAGNAADPLTLTPTSPDATVAKLT